VSAGRPTMGTAPAIGSPPPRGHSGLTTGGFTASPVYRRF
jgi:hypothetical protein